ncbi:MAG: hypothetical protein WHS43_00770 [Aquificaceae bacterium]|uniref:hypothetical protein n=1 Tax=Hydrogenobacter sp. Uz 6-8 TaxID=3384828 RepID=UPI000F0F0E2F|nr:MAG: hypothetical protein D6804_08220 [Aquificota bacterium]
MRFFVSADIRRNKPLYYAVIFFLLFTTLFWLASWLHFYSKYGFSYNSLVKYFFMDPEFPERVSLAQISEDFHVGVFLHGFIILTLSSVFSLFNSNSAFKRLLVLLVSISALSYLSVDFLILLLNAFWVVWLKLFFFVLYQILLAIMLIYTGWKLSFGNMKPPKVSMLKVLSLLFSFFSIFFILSNFVNFHAKMGFGVQGIRDYFLGNPELFLKPKSFEGVFKVFYPHILAMALYSLALIHLLPFAGVDRKKSITLGLFVFLFSFLDNFSSLLLLYGGSPFAYLKFMSFWSFQLCALFASIVLLVASVKREGYTGLHL